MFAHTICKNAWKVWNFAVPLHRQSEIKLMTRITFKENKKIKERVTKMKKILMTLVALMSMTTMFAENEGMNNTEAYNMTVNMTKLAKALNLTVDQVESVAEVHKTFSSEMLFAAQYGKDERTKMVNKAITKDLAYMHSILNNEQYHKYLTLLNVTLVNRGLK